MGRKMAKMEMTKYEDEIFNVVVMNAEEELDKSSKWCIDSGATKHLCNEKEQLSIKK